jgi:Spy/CpxP family protein refolding chaperone
MKLTRTSIALAAIAGLFALSPSVRAQTNAPSSTSTNSIPPQGRRGGGLMSTESQLSRLSEQLKLTDEQKPKVKAVLEGQNKQLQVARDLPPEERRAKLPSIREETDKKMQAILTADQYKQYEQMRGRGGRRPTGGNAGGNAGGGQ